ncbi:MAG: PAS domain S-box protein, partial [Syntrophales bacterium]
MNIRAKSIQQIIRNTYERFIFPEMHDREMLRRLKLMYLLSLIAVICNVLFGIIAFFKHNTVIVLADFGVAAALFLNIVHATVYRKYQLNMYFGIFCISSLFLYLILTGGPHQATFVWSYTIPLIAAFVLGSRGGALVSVFMLVPTMILFAVPHPESPFANYHPDLKLRFLVSYLIVSISAYLFEMAREKNEESLRDSEEKYRYLVERARTGIYEVDLTARKFLSVNDPMCQYTGYTREEFLSMDPMQLLTEKSQQSFIQRLAKILAGEPVPDNIEYQIKRKNGSEIWVILNTSYSYEPNDRILSTVIVLDITERKRAEGELRLLAERLQRAEKMETLGTLAGGVAHDLNNVLGVLVGYSELLLQSVPQESPFQGHAMQIFKGGQRAAEIIQDLLTLTRRGVLVSETLNLNRVISDFLQMPEFEAIKSHHPGVKFKTSLDAELLNMKGSSTHLSKTVMNLLSNAAEAISGSGDVLIRTENRYVDRPIHGYDTTQEGEYAVLTVSDTGSGISSSDLGRIFEPFYTKKVMGRSGTGLGLAVVWGTVKDHSGYIDVQSTEGKGTTFTLYFPVTREDLTKIEEVVPQSTYLGRGEHILVVDDV